MDNADRFATLSDRKLIETIDHPEDCEPAAVEAARIELSRRGLSEEEILVIRAEISQKDRVRHEAKAKLDRLSADAKATVEQVHRTFVLPSDEAPSEIRQRNFMLFAIAAKWLSVAPRYLDLSWLLEGGYDGSTIDYFLPLLLLPVALYLIWRRRRAGWFQGAAVTTYSIVGAFILAVMDWGRQPTGLVAVDDLFPVSSRAELLVRVSYALGLAAAFHLRRSVDLFRISERDRWLTVIVALMLSYWQWADLLLG